MRLDVYLSEKSIVKSRTYAQEAIREGRVSVNGQIILKPSYEVSDETILLHSKEIEFVSRGGYKLYEALHDFDIDLKNQNVADIGASTGGFSDVALQSGANHVYAIDVGTLQLDESLRENPRLTSMENTNALDLKIEDFKHEIHFVVMDVSFVSIKTLLPHLISLFPKARFVVLIKPQFEAGKKYIGKNGIIKDKKVHEKVLEDIYYFLLSHQCSPLHMSKSKTKGKDGNQEYFIDFVIHSSSSTFPVSEIKKLVR